METPNNITFFIPSTIEELDQTIEPTLEGVGGTDYLGNAIADGGQVINAMDSYSSRPFSPTTIGSTSSWRVDAELDEREKAGFIMVDQHNLRNVYTAATKEQIEISHNTVNTFSSSTAPALVKEWSGILGEDPPYLNFDGIDDNVTTADVPGLNFGINSFTIEVLFRFNTLSDGAIVWGKKSTLAGTDAGWNISYTAATNVFTFRTTNGSSIVLVDSGTNQTIEAGKLYHLVCLRDASTPLVSMYVNDVLSTSSASVTARDVDNAIDLIMGNDSTGSDMDVYVARLYDLILTETQIAALSSGDSTDSIGLTIYSDLLHDDTATSDQLTEGDSVDSWTGVDANLLSTDIADDGLKPHNGTYKMSITNTDTIGYAYQAVTTVIGVTYRISGWLYDSSAVLGSLTLAVGTSVGLEDLGESDSPTLANTWEYREIDFTATGTTTYMMVREKGQTSDVTFADNVSLIQLGLSLEYHSSGINKGEGKWLNSTSNALTGTVSGCKYINVPESSNDYYLGAFNSEADAQYWFTNFNSEALLGTATGASIGQVAFGKAYTFPTQLLPTGGYSGDYDFPGIILNETDTGRFQSEEKFGSRPTWNLNFALSTTSQFKDMQDMLDFLKGSNYPFWVSFNYDDLDPVVWRVRLEGGLSWSYQHGPAAKPWSPRISLIKDL